ncbi:BOP1NT-domain-containing protein [Ascobolus immersus RN42]|uniref:Ribosome biogenesis protein ERB1 n=1 Tax=Ascobolus immersus RN42 TaxID=1160509 RepID=A0A3N4HU61_ASCIM|nr:BOP1NT-domain-containing protein [Ascobolus immersus RN42]
MEDDEDEEEEESDEDEVPFKKVTKPRTLSEASKPSASSVNSDTEYQVDDELPEGTRVVKDSAGNARYIYPEIDPRYDTDDTDVEETNTIGNIPLDKYELYPHIGYDINGERIMRPATGEALDALLEQIDLPKGWTGIIDKNTGKGLNLSREELDILKKITRNEIPEEGYDPYPDMVEYFTSKTEVMPLSSAPEPKRRFIPSKHEAKRVMKIVKAIREGRIIPNKPKEKQEEQFYDIWADNPPPRPDHIMNIPAPKLPPPTHNESYNPPAEYLPTEKEKKEWEEMEPEDRDQDYLPKKYSALRLVPGYDKNINERFERCLDLYLAPRVRRKKLNIDPESLLPKLPSPKDLRPFPTFSSHKFIGHIGKVRSVSVDPLGLWLATGGDDGTVRVWEITSGIELWQIRLGQNEAVTCVRWRPTTEFANAYIIAASVGDHVHLLVPPFFPKSQITAGMEVIQAGYGHATAGTESSAKWTKPPSTLTKQGLALTITVKAPIKHISWHRKGDYFATTSPNQANNSIYIHHLPSHKSQLPFRKTPGLPQLVEFHPIKPHLYLATQRHVRIYDLAKQNLLKVLQPGSKWISSMSIHPHGNNIIIGSYDKRLLWHDLDLSTKPYKTLRYHQRAIRSVSFHMGAKPLFATASDDGTIQIFHGQVFNDLGTNPRIVPLKILRGHKITDGLGVLEITWHDREEWLFSAGADGVVRMWQQSAEAWL